MDTCTCMAESLHCSPETITKLFIGYTQYKMLLVLKRTPHFFYSTYHSLKFYYLFSYFLHSQNTYFMSTHHHVHGALLGAG